MWYLAGFDAVGPGVRSKRVRPVQSPSISSLATR
ncbi:unnamed protein product [Haemonchus placei]|uniref:Transposase n=1 Tax=Haemonchus placei TaxID=6290 RepID=A0A0N4X829_HAEPC|nr:unnamed protein product [Haemonchus placei]